MDIMQLLRDNLTLWSAAGQGSDDEELQVQEVEEVDT